MPEQDIKISCTVYAEGTSCLLNSAKTDRYGLWLHNHTIIGTRRLLISLCVTLFLMPISSWVLEDGFSAGNLRNNCARERDSTIKNSKLFRQTEMNKADINEVKTVKLCRLVWVASCWKHSSSSVSTGNTFQDLPRLREAADNTERNI
jgi:hypothetical protein